MNLNSLEAAFAAVEQPPVTPEVTLGENPQLAKFHRKWINAARQSTHTIVVPATPAGTPPVTSANPAKATKRYVIEQTALYYDQGRNILLDRQVLPFVRLGHNWRNPDFRFCRLHCLMEDEDGAVRPQLLEEQELQNDPTMSDGTTYTCQGPDSSMGFLGERKRVNRQLRLNDYASHLSLSDASFRNCMESDAEKLLPEFYVAVSAQEASRQQKLGETVRQMFDLEMNQMRWFNKLKVGPVVLTGPGRIASYNALHDAIYRRFAFEMIYIAMPGTSNRGEGSVLSKPLDRINHRVSTVEYNSDAQLYEHRLETFCFLQTRASDTFACDVLDARDINMVASLD